MPRYKAQLHMNLDAYEPTLIINEDEDGDDSDDGDEDDSDDGDEEDM